jgi:hypothetical protein
VSISDLSLAFQASQIFIPLSVLQSSSSRPLVCTIPSVASHVLDHHSHDLPSFEHPIFFAFPTFNTPLSTPSRFHARLISASSATALDFDNTRATLPQHLTYHQVPYKIDIGAVFNAAPNLHDSIPSFKPVCFARVFFKKSNVFMPLCCVASSMMTSINHANILQFSIYTISLQVQKEFVLDIDMTDYGRP